jgi:hypothetical protein
LGRADRYFTFAGSAFLEPNQQRIVGGELIQPATTRRTIVEMVTDAGLLCLGKLTQRQRTQLYDSRMV